MAVDLPRRRRRGWLPLARPLPPDTQVLVGKIAAALYLTSGVGGLIVAFMVVDRMPHPALLGVVAGTAQLVGLACLLLTLTRPELVQRFFAHFAYTLIFGAIAVATLAQYSAGPNFVVVSIVYVEITIFAFYLLPLRRALATTALTGASHVAVLSLQEGYVAPFAQWMYLSMVLLAVGLTFRQLLSQGADESVQLSRLRRFLAPQVADALLEFGSGSALDPHRRQIAVLFCDLRGFTRFASAAEPEDVVQVLDEYYAAAGERLREAEATVGAFAGDGLMAYFNDPVPCDEPALRAIEVAVSIQRELEGLRVSWARRGIELGHGIGIAYGYATLGVIGFEGRSDYTALGSVVNLASRLSDVAGPGEILVDQRAYDAARAARAGASRTVELKGFVEPVTVYALGIEAAELS